VSCTFVYTFSATGSHTIQITASKVVPADWDTSNNSVTGAITILDIGIAQHGWAFFNGLAISLSSLFSDERTYQGNVLENVVSNYSMSQNNQSSNVGFYSLGCAGISNAVLWQFPVNVTYSETMDGVPVYSSTDSTVVGYSVSAPDNRSLCNSTVTSHTLQYSNNFTADHSHYLYAIEFFDGAGNVVYSQQSLSSSRNAGDVTYFSSGYQCYFWTAPSGTCDNPSDYYAWNSSGGQSLGTIIPVGSTWVPAVSTQDSAGNTFSGSFSVPMNSGSYTNSPPPICYNYGPDTIGFTYQSCSSSTYTFASASADASY
jgi:hypothetical protein